MRNILALVVIAFLWIAQPLWAAETDVGAVETQRVTLKWLGNTGWEIQVGQTKILIDPFLTRKEAIAGKEWKTDEETVLKVIAGADYIFAGHSHADHIGDVPFIAKRFGSKVIGSRTTTNIELTAGVAKEQLTTIRGGEKLMFRDFTVQVIESQHGVLKKFSSPGPDRYWGTILSRVAAFSTTSPSVSTAFCTKARETLSKKI